MVSCTIEPTNRRAGKRRYRTEFLRDERGQTLVLVALSITCVLGILGFGTDVGVLLRDRRRIQVAADSAAIAGAGEIRYATIDSKTVSTAARTAASQNGFTHGSNGVVVTVNDANGPLTGPHTGDTNYVEVFVQMAAPTYFMRVFGLTSVTVNARSVAGLGNVPNSTCGFILDSAASGSLQGQGNSNTTFNCGVIVNSNSSSAIGVTGGAGTITANSIAVVGGSAGGSISPAPRTGVAPISDPLGFLSLPNTSSLFCSAPTGGTLTGTIGPSTVGGTVCYSGNVTLSGTTLSQGTYVFTGNVAISGAVSSGSGGATLDIASGSFSANSGSSLSITAPTTGPYSGIAMMQPASNTNTLTFVKGNSGGTINGIIYAPGAELYLQDHAGGLTITSDVIVKTIFNKASTLNVTSYTQLHPTTSVLKFAALAE